MEPLCVNGNDWNAYQNSAKTELKSGAACFKHYNFADVSFKRKDVHKI